MNLTGKTRNLFVFTVCCALSAAPAIDPAAILNHIKVLASDEFAGRSPGTPGEKKTVEYLTAQAKQLGLKPGNPDGTYVQNVPLWGIRSKGVAGIRVGVKGWPLTQNKDYVAWSFQPKPDVSVDKSPLVFVGYGIEAPEYHHNDYANIDVKGATVVVLSGDPGFLGKQLSYYGRPGAKYETAFAHGAAALVNIYIGRNGTSDLTAMARNYGRENMILRNAASSKRLNAQVFVTVDKAKEILAACNQDLDALRKAAAQPNFRPVKLSADLTATLSNSVREINSANVIAKLPGADPKLRTEFVVYSGHWDHLGQDGTTIYHGASDNAAGAAGVLEIARAFTKLSPAPRRTVLFLWPTAEEKGLLGAKYYVENPLYPLAATVANLNLDYFSNWGWGRTHDIGIVGKGNSTLDDLLEQAAKRQGRVVTGDTAPEEGFYFRSDHWEFAKGGVPSLETSPGIEHLGKPAGFGAQMRAEYIKNDYHKATDQPKPGWDLTGAAEDLQLLVDVGYKVAQDNGRPAWKPNPPHRPLPVKTPK